MKAFVANASKKGCFLRLSLELTGQVLMKDLADNFVENISEQFPIGKLVEARLLSYNKDDNFAKLSLKSSAIGGNKVSQEQIKKLKEGSIITGTVQRVTDTGVFISIDKTVIVGLSRKATAIGDMNQNLKDVYQAGDIVKAKVLSVSVNSGKVALGLKESYFRKDITDEEETEEDNVSVNASDSEMEVENEEDSDVADQEEADDDEVSSDGEDSDAIEVEMLEDGESDDESVERLIKV